MAAATTDAIAGAGADVAAGADPPPAAAAFAAAASLFFLIISANPPPLPPPPPLTVPRPGIDSAGLAAGACDAALLPPSATVPAPFGIVLSIVSAFFNCLPLFQITIIDY